MKPCSFIFSLMGMLFTINLFAQVPYQIGEPQIHGEGCPRGAVHASVAPDGSAISILFDNFSLALPAGRYPMQRLNTVCRFRIPVEMNPGVNLEATAIDYRGYANIPERCQASIITEGPIFKLSRFRPNDNFDIQTFGQMNDIFSVRQNILQDFRGRCQGQRFIEFTTTLKLTGIYFRPWFMLPAETLFSVDSADLGGVEEGADGAAVRLGIRVAPCQ